MSLSNGGFDTAGTNAWDAANWSVSVVATNATMFAVWDTGIVGFAETGAETFVGWGSFSTAFAGFFTDLTYAFFDLPTDPKNVEDFEDLWGSAPASTLVADNGSDDGPYALADGMTLTIAVNGVVQNITLNAVNFTDITDARPEELANAINLTLVDAEGVLDGGAIRLQTVATGPGASIQVTGGTALPFLPFDVLVHYGTPVGSAFIPTLEYSFAPVGPNASDVESFERNWVNDDFYKNPMQTAPTTAGDFVTDTGDTVRTMIINAADGFDTGWGSYNLSLGGGVTYTFAAFTGTGTTESFEGTWTPATTF